MSLRDFSLVANVVAPPFIIACVSIYWTMFVRFIFFCLRIEKSVLKAWIIFIPLYFYFSYYLIFYVFDYIGFIFSKKYILLREAYSSNIVGLYFLSYALEFLDWLRNLLHK